MERIQFDENNELSGLITKNSQAVISKRSFVMKLMEKAGITDKNTANFILLGITAILLGITFYLYFKIMSPRNGREVTSPEVRSQIVHKIKR